VRSVHEHDWVHRWRCVLFFADVDTQFNAVAYFRNAVGHATKPRPPRDHDPEFAYAANRVGRLKAPSAADQRP
jgi:hypothetical protein